MKTIKPVGQQIAERDFSKGVIQGLAKQGITWYGTTCVPDENGSFCFSETAYVINDNGTSKIKSYREIIFISGTNKGAREILGI